MVDVKKPETSLTGRPLFNFSGEISDFDNFRKRVFFLNRLQKIKTR